MNRKRVFSYLSCLLLLALSFTAAPLYAQTTDCISQDYTSIQDTLVQSQDALRAGDVATSIQLEHDANKDLKAIIQDCAVAPMLSGMGFDQSTVDTVAAMPFCQYRFEATVRSGPDAGVNLTGVLALMQNTPTSAVGYVYPLDPEAKPVPVSAVIGENLDVTLNLVLSENATIVGTGYFTAGVDACYGGIEGLFTGPAKDDTGDWLGNSCTSNPSSLNCTPAILITPSDELPILQPFKPQKPEKEPGDMNPPTMCTPIRDAACLAACGDDASCKFNCPTVGSMCK